MVVFPVLYTLLLANLLSCCCTSVDLEPDRLLPFKDAEPSVTCDDCVVRQSFYSNDESFVRLSFHSNSYIRSLALKICLTSELLSVTEAHDRKTVASSSASRSFSPDLLNVCCELLAEILKRVESASTPEDLEKIEVRYIPMFAIYHNVGAMLGHKEIYELLRKIEAQFSLKKPDRIEASLIQLQTTKPARLLSDLEYGKFIEYYRILAYHAPEESGSISALTDVFQELFFPDIQQTLNNIVPSGFDHENMELSRISKEMDIFLFVKNFPENDDMDESCSPFAFVNKMSALRKEFRFLVCGIINKQKKKIDVQRHGSLSNQVVNEQLMGLPSFDTVIKKFQAFIKDHSQASFDEAVDSMPMLFAYGTQGPRPLRTVYGLLILKVLKLNLLSLVSVESLYSFSARARETSLFIPKRAREMFLSIPLRRVRPQILKRVKALVDRLPARHELELEPRNPPQLVRIRNYMKKMFKNRIARQFTRRRTRKRLKVIQQRKKRLVYNIGVNSIAAITLMCVLYAATR